MKRKRLLSFLAIVFATCAAQSWAENCGSNVRGSEEGWRNETSTTISDERLKMNIEPLKSSLEKVMKLQGVSYLFKEPRQAGRGVTGGKEIGLIAQKVEAVLPEIVLVDARGYKSLAYDRLAAVLIEAVKEQQAMISRLEELNKEQKKLIGEKELRIERLEEESAFLLRAVEELSGRIAAMERAAENAGPNP